MSFNMEYSPDNIYFDDDYESEYSDYNSAQ